MFIPGCFKKKGIPPECPSFLQHTMNEWLKTRQNKFIAILESGHGVLPQRVFLNLFIQFFQSK